MFYVLWHNRVQIGCLFLLLTVDDCVLVHEMTIGMLIICHDRGMNMHAHVLQSMDWWRADVRERHRARRIRPKEINYSVYRYLIFDLTLKDASIPLVNDTHM